MAKEAGVGLLALTHLSSRFMPREVRAEAEAVFPSVIVPRDFDQIEVPFPERGQAHLERWSERRAREQAGRQSRPGSAPAATETAQNGEEGAAAAPGGVASQ